MAEVPGPQVRHLRFDDFDDLAAAAEGWDLDLRPLDRGPYFGEMVQVATASALFSYARFAGTLRQTGSPPPGVRTFAVPAHAGVRFQWRGEEVNGAQVLLFPPGAELHALSRPDFEVFTWSVAEEILDGIASELQIPGTAGLFGGGVVRCHPAAVTVLRQLLNAVKEAAEAQGRLATRNQALMRLEADVARCLVEVIASSRTMTGRHLANRRNQAIWKAESYINANRKSAITIRELSRRADVSVRTLELAFRESLGVSPKAYLKASRLNGVRRELQFAAGRRLRISEAANRWGFTHLSQFAADYRRLFGELPSDTVVRG